MKNLDGNKLIAELKKDPKVFFDSGKSYDLLQEYFKGFDIRSLSSLLMHENIIVRRVAIWIVSEVNVSVLGLKKEITNLLKDNDRYIKFYTLESIMGLSSSAPDLFRHVVSALESDDWVIRKLGMFLISNATDMQLKGAVKYYSNINHQEHIKGLKFISDADKLTPSHIDEFLHNENEFFPRYAAIFLKRNMEHINQKRYSTLKRSTDESVRKFANSWDIK